MPSKEVIKATAAGVVTTTLLSFVVYYGSRNLQHFDAALFAYLFATLFAAFGIAYRLAMWMQRPPTAMYWKRGWQVFIHPRYIIINLFRLGDRIFRRFVLTDFIFRRSWKRGIAHWLIMWGCLLAAAITFPLVFGWVHFDTLPGDFSMYRAFVFGFPIMSFKIDSLFAHIMFHGLVWSSFLVIPGVMLAFRRRMREHGAAAVQRFGEDILPLFMLFAISVTGLLIWVSYSWMHGYAYEFLAILHAVTVILTLLWLPFGKFFHIFQRPAQLGVSFYKDMGEIGERAHCARCNQDYASQMHVDDLITVEKQLGYQYELAGSTAGASADDTNTTKPDAQSAVQPVTADHYQRICPKCRRALFALAQGKLWSQSLRPDQA